MQYIVSRLSQLDCSRWNVTEHTFEDDTPLGRKNFTNIIATLDPAVDKRLVLAAHYDSKVIDGARFLGATDSALSVALLIDMALTLDSKLQEREVSGVGGGGRGRYKRELQHCTKASYPYAFLLLFETRGYKAHYNYIYIHI